MLVGLRRSFVRVACARAQRSARAELAALQPRPLHDVRADRHGHRGAEARSHATALVLAPGRPSGEQVVSEAPYSPLVVEHFGPAAQRGPLRTRRRRHCRVCRRPCAGRALRSERAGPRRSHRGVAVRGLWLPALHRRRLAPQLSACRGRRRMSCAAGAGVRRRTNWSSRRRSGGGCSSWRTPYAPGGAVAAAECDPCINSLTGSIVQFAGRMASCMNLNQSPALTRPR